MTQAPLDPGAAASGAGVTAGSVATAMTLGVLTLVTLVGNVLVFLAVLSDHKLRTVSNLFIVSLSLADLLVGTVVMMPAALSEVCQRWVLGEAFCPVWASFDVMLCSASVLNVCLISFDRYLAIMTPLRYNALMTSRRAGVLLVSAWSIAVASSFVPITNGWHNPTHNTLANLTTGGPVPQCVLRVSLPYALTASFITIFLPIIIAFVLYCRVSEEAKRQSVFVRSLIAPSRVLLGQELTTNSIREPFTRKATVTLGVIVGAYVVTWMPFLITNVIDAQCKCVPTKVFGAFVWLGYCNSLINPIIYPLLMRDFRKVYMTHFKACCPTAAFGLLFHRKSSKQQGVKDTPFNSTLDNHSHSGAPDVKNSVHDHHKVVGTPVPQRADEPRRVLYDSSGLCDDNRKIVYDSSGLFDDPRNKFVYDSSGLCHDPRKVLYDSSSLCHDPRKILYDSSGFCEDNLLNKIVYDSSGFCSDKSPVDKVMGDSGVSDISDKGMCDSGVGDIPDKTTYDYGLFDSPVVYDYSPNKSMMYGLGVGDSPNKSLAHNLGVGEYPEKIPLHSDAVCDISHNHKGMVYDPDLCDSSTKLITDDYNPLHAVLYDQGIFEDPHSAVLDGMEYDKPGCFDRSVCDQGRIENRNVGNLEGGCEYDTPGDTYEEGVCDQGMFKIPDRTISDGCEYNDTPGSYDHGLCDTHNKVSYDPSHCDHSQVLDGYRQPHSSRKFTYDKVFCDKPSELTHNHAFYDNHSEILRDNALRENVSEVTNNHALHEIPSEVTNNMYALCSNPGEVTTHNRAMYDNPSDVTNNHALRDSPREFTQNCALLGEPRDVTRYHDIHEKPREVTCGNVSDVTRKHTLLDNPSDVTHNQTIYNNPSEVTCGNPSNVRGVRALYDNPSDVTHNHAIHDNPREVTNGNPTDVTRNDALPNNPSQVEYDPGMCDDYRTIYDMCVEDLPSNATFDHTVGGNANDVFKYDQGICATHNTISHNRPSACAVGDHSNTVSCELVKCHSTPTTISHNPSMLATGDHSNNVSCEQVQGHSTPTTPISHDPRVCLYLNGGLSETKAGQDTHDSTLDHRGVCTINPSDILYGDSACDNPNQFAIDQTFVQGRNLVRGDRIASDDAHLVMNDQTIGVNPNSVVYDPTVGESSTCMFDQTTGNNPNNVMYDQTIVDSPKKTNSGNQNKFMYDQTVGDTLDKVMYDQAICDSPHLVVCDQPDDNPTLVRYDQAVSDSPKVFMHDQTVDNSNVTTYDQTVGDSPHLVTVDQTVGDSPHLVTVDQTVGDMPNKATCPSVVCAQSGVVVDDHDSPVSDSGREDAGRERCRQVSNGVGRGDDQQTDHEC